MSKQVRTTCPYCGVGCGVIATPKNDSWSIKGDPDHPANFGRLCSKGSNLAETISLEGRLLQPEVNDQEVSWDTALDTVANKFKELAKEHGPQSVGFYLSGQLLTEDYYVANKLAKGFIGTNNVDTNSRLCMASSVAGHKRAFGYDTVPACYEDLDLADLVVLVGSNAAWCHPVLFQRIQKNRKERGARLVTIDVRQTATTDSSDLAIILKPGSDAFLFNGLLCALDQYGALDVDFTETHCNNFSETLGCARESAPDAQTVAEQCGLDVDNVRMFFDWFTQTEKTVTCYSLGIHMSSSGTDKVNSILNCHLATGRIGKPGAGPLSLTGQPNAMGGREVGGLANQLAAHMGYDDGSIEKVQMFWQAPNMTTAEGLKAVDMFQAVADGTIKAIWIQSTNPAVSLTDLTFVKKALNACEFVVVSDCVDKTDTLEFADVKLPATAWGEKNGTVTNSERRISRQRAFMPVPGLAKPDWWIVNEVAKRMGFASAFDYQGVSDIFDEHARLSAYRNFNERDFDISGLCDLSSAEYENLEPVQWPVTEKAPKGTARLFADGQFYGDNRKAEMIAVRPRMPVEKANETFPLIAISGRIRDQWHTMTRTGRSQTLSRHRHEPFVEISQHDAEKFDLCHMGLARVTSKLASSIYRVRVESGQPVDTVFLPIHWSGFNSSGGLTGALYASHTDPVSGQPEGKSIPVSIDKIDVKYAGLILSRKSVNPKLPIFYSRRKSNNCFLHSLALEQEPDEGWTERVARFLGKEIDELIVYEDATQGVFRSACFVDGKIDIAVFISPGVLPLEEIEAERWFNANISTDHNQWMSLSPKSIDGSESQGPTVCSCFSIGTKTIEQAVACGKAKSVEDIGELLGAGTNCGSCLPEIRKLVAST